MAITNDEKRKQLSEKQRNRELYKSRESNIKDT